MAIDVQMILEKGRVPLESLELTVEGQRREEPPRYFEDARMVFRLRGPATGDAAKVQRAIDLSRDKYCSVLHTLRPDLSLGIELEYV